MRLLLDTHILLWLLIGDLRLSQDMLDTLADPRHTVYVSAVCSWEIAIKAGLGKLAVPPDLVSWLPTEIAAAGLTPLPIQIEHTLGVERLPRHHADPFDRLLIAQAIADGLTIVSADGAFSRYGVPLLRCS